MKKIICFAILLFFKLSGFSQSGCTDPQATNYNPVATVNDGSCSYASTNLSLTSKANLATPVLDESSGIAFIASGLWTHNDSGNSNSLYRVDSTNGNILQSVVVSNATNVDWEDMTSGPDFIYVGDFGNNNGNRTNLKVYRIAKSDLTPTATTVVADVINFSFSDQTSFVSAPNNHNFDCESMIFYNDSLHLFSKNWVDKHCRHYVLPALPGTYSAQVKESFNPGNLITGATIQEGGVIALIGYDKTGIVPISIWMLYDYSGNLFFNGNKRKFNLSSAIVNGQTEGIAFKNGAYGYISNERFQQNPFNIAPSIKSFNLGPYLPVAFVNPPPVANFSANRDTLCKGKTVQFSDLSIQNPVTWNWSFPGGTPSFSTLQNPVITYNAVGNFAVELIVSNSFGQYDTLLLPNYITVLNLPAANVVAGGPLVFCTGGSVNLMANTGTGFLYQWKKSSQTIIGATASSYTALSTGTYKVIVTNSMGCSKSSNTVTVTGPPSASFTAASPLLFCIGDSVVFTANSGVGYSWQWKKNGVPISGAVLPNYTAYTGGTYKVIVTNSAACSKVSNSKTVIVNCREELSSLQPAFSLFPNPVSTTLSISATEKIIDFIIFDFSGREVMEIYTSGLNAASGIMEVDIQNLSDGLYVVKLISNQNQTFLKFIKN